MTTKPWWKEPTRAQWAAFAAAWVGWVLDAFDFMIYTLVATQISNEFHVSRVVVLGSLTLTLLVRLAGGAFAGWMADRWGRKLPLLLSLVWFMGFDSAIFFSHSFAAILVFRTLFGFGMGAQWTAGTALAMESMPARCRKITSGILQAGWPFGVILAATVGHFVITDTTWRPMFLVGLIPAALSLPLWFMFSSTKPARREHKRSAFADFAAPGVLRMLVLGSLVMSLGFIVYYGMQSTYAVLLVTELHQTPAAAMIYVILFNLGMLVGVILAGMVAARWGVITALVTPALLMVPALPLYVGMAGSLAVGAILGGMLGVGYSGVTPVLTTSLFPEQVRARAIGLIYHIGAFVAAFVPTLIPWLAGNQHWKMSSTIALVVGAALVLMSAAILVLRREIVPGEPASAEAPRSTPANDHVLAVELHHLDPSRTSQPFERALEL